MHNYDDVCRCLKNKKLKNTEVVISFMEQSRIKNPRLAVDRAFENADIVDLGKFIIKSDYISDTCIYLYEAGNTLNYVYKISKTRIKYAVSNHKNKYEDILSITSPAGVVFSTHYVSVFVPEIARIHKNGGKKAHAKQTSAKKNNLALVRAANC